MNRRPEFPELQRYGELMHLHENAKGRVGKIVTAGQLCKIGECNLNKPDECNFGLSSRPICAIAHQEPGPICRDRAM